MSPQATSLRSGSLQNARGTQDPVRPAQPTARQPGLSKQGLLQQRSSLINSPYFPVPRGFRTEKTGAQQSLEENIKTHFLLDPPAIWIVQPLNCHNNSGWEGLCTSLRIPRSALHLDWFFLPPWGPLSSMTPK